jgi:EmrB/QacA subfamily drug resistance transporter
MAIFGIASLLSAYAQTPSQLIWSRALMGFGAAAIMPQTLSIITNVFEPRERGRAIGIWAGAVGLGVAIGPVTGGLLLDHFWWGSVFLLNVPVVAAGLVAMFVLVPESRNPVPGKLDPIGVLASIVGLIALSYGIIQGGERGDWLAPGVVGPIVAGVAVLALFVWHEAHTDNPAFDVRLFRDPRLSAGVAAVGMGFFAMAGVFFFTSFYMQSVLGLSPVAAGAMSVPFAVAQLAFAPASGVMVNRFGAKAVCTTGLSLITVALVGYQFIDESSPLWVLGLIFFVQGVGMANVMPPATESVMSALPREKAGAGSAINNAVRQVAVAMGVAVLGSVIASIYRAQLADRFQALPTESRHTASESIEGTLAVASRMGAAGQSLIEPAHAAFVQGMHAAAGVSAVVAFLATLTVFKWMPGRRSAEPEPVVPAPERETAPVP